MKPEGVLQCVGGRAMQDESMYGLGRLCQEQTIEQLPSEGLLGLVAPGILPPATLIHPCTSSLHLALRAGLRPLQIVDSHHPWYSPSARPILLQAKLSRQFGRTRQSEVRDSNLIPKIQKDP